MCRFGNRIDPDFRGLTRGRFSWIWGERRGSNPRHSGPQPDALPAELRPPWICKRNTTGF